MQPRENAALPRSSLLQAGPSRCPPARSSPARPLDGWEGRYCHYDYPAHQGRVLHEAVTGSFAGDVEAARRYLIDEHPAGWSYLGGDFTKPAGFVEGLAASTTAATSATATAIATTSPPRSSPRARRSSSPTTATSSATSGSPCSSPAPAVSWSAAPRSPGQPSPTGTTSTTACGGEGRHPPLWFA
jgi:hypothetical protein